MTPEQKKEISKLRVQGLGYQKIATALGLTKNQVELRQADPSEARHQNDKVLLRQMLSGMVEQAPGSNSQEASRYLYLHLRSLW